MFKSNILINEILVYDELSYIITSYNDTFDQLAASSIDVILEIYLILIFLEAFGSLFQLGERLFRVFEFSRILYF